MTRYDILLGRTPPPEKAVTDNGDFPYRHLPACQSAIPSQISKDIIEEAWREIAQTYRSHMLPGGALLRHPAAIRIRVSGRV